jgi:hypothetical protein
MRTQSDLERHKIATINLKKVTIFLAVVGAIVVYLGWIRYPFEEEGLLREMAWVIRIVSIVVIYVALKCFLILRYFNASRSTKH